MEIERKCYPDEIAEAFQKLLPISDEEKLEAEEALYTLKYHSENEYNDDCYRTLYRILCQMTEKVEMKEIFTEK